MQLVSHRPWCSRLGCPSLLKSSLHCLQHALAPRFDCWRRVIGVIALARQRRGAIAPVKVLDHAPVLVARRHMWPFVLQLELRATVPLVPAMDQVLMPAKPGPTRELRLAQVAADGQGKALLDPAECAEVERASLHRKP